MPTVRGFIRGICLVSLWLSCLPAAGQVVELFDNRDAFLSIKDFAVLEDRTKSLTIHQVVSPRFAGRFTYRNPRGDRGAVYWARLHIRDHSVSSRFILRLYSHQCDRVDFYAPAGKNTFAVTHSGGGLPFHHRKYKYKDILFELPAAGTSRTYYLRFESGRSFRFTGQIKPVERLFGFSMLNYLEMGLLYGAICIIGLYNLFIYLTIRERKYLYYVLYIASFLVYIMDLDGTAFQFFWPDHPQFKGYAFALSNTGFVVFNLLFSRHFLSTARYTPRLDACIVGLIGLKLVWLVLKLLLQERLPYLYYHDLIPFVFPYAAALICLKKGYKPARYYVMGLTILFLSYLLFAMVMQGLIDLRYLGFQVIKYGQVAESLFLSLALADRMKILKQKKINAQRKIIRLKEKANQALERKVAERTRQLWVANEQLRVANGQLHTTNEKLQVQGEEIRRINRLLRADNQKLCSDVADIARARVMQRKVNFEEFRKIYPDEDSCYAFLADLKWKNGYNCKRCGNAKYSNGCLPYSRRCTKCYYDESPAVFTIFYRLKFPVLNAFYLVFLVASNRSITAVELSHTLQMRRATCLSFKKKILECMDEKNFGKSRPGKEGWAALILNADYPSVKA